MIGTDTHRRFTAIGRAQPSDRPDVGATVCAVFNVGRKILLLAAVRIWRAQCRRFWRGHLLQHQLVDPVSLNWTALLALASAPDGENDPRTVCFQIVARGRDVHGR